MATSYLNIKLVDSGKNTNYQLQNLILIYKIQFELLHKLYNKIQLDQKSYTLFGLQYLFQLFSAQTILIVMIKQEKQEYNPTKRQQKIFNQTSFLKEEALDGSMTKQIKRRGKKKKKTKQARSQSTQKAKQNKNNVKQEALSKSFSNNNYEDELEETENYEIDRPQKVIGIRYNKKIGQNQYLIKWFNYQESESTWESIKNLQGCKVLITMYMEELQRQLPLCDPLFTLPPMPNVEPIAIISIQDGYCWLSWPFRDNYEKPDATRVKEVVAKQYYPKLYKDRKNYEQIIKKGYKEVNEKLIAEQDYYDDKALCVYDIRKGLCLLMVRNYDEELQMVWCDMTLVNPLLILEYFSVQNWIYKL
ncbi:hypothetical protein pb186bvf_014167 [Paramecium bursaria]